MVSESVAHSFCAHSPQSTQHTQIVDKLLQHKRMEISWLGAQSRIYSFKYSGFCICRRHLDAEGRPYAARVKTTAVQGPELAGSKYG